MNLDRYAQDCSELHAAGVGRVWLCRLLRPTLGKKFFVLFAILAATGVANWLVVEATLSARQGMAALVNVTGSLRWLSQRIQLDTLRIVRGDAQARDRVHVDANLVKLDEAIRSLQEGGSAQGIAIRGLPDELQADIALVRQTSASLGRHTERALAEPARGTENDALLSLMYAEGTILLKTADAIAARLTRQSQQAEQEIMDKLERLGLLDLILFVAALLAIRMRVVHPLRKLAAVSRGFAEGRRELRSGFRSLDEIGQFALAFDTMADTIERDLRQMAAGAVELEKKQQELRKFSLAIEHGPVSVLITDAAGTIEYVNPKFTETTGYAPEEAIGRQPNILKSGLTPSAVFADMWQRLRSGRQWHGELLNRKKNGELFWEDTRIAPLKDDAGRITHFVAVKEDISGRKRSEAEIQDHSVELERRVAERTRQLSESNRELESFSYSISHDLRAPLRALNGFASLMAENCGNCVKTESLEYMARIQRASVRMGNLMDDILDLSRVTRSEIRIEQVDLSAMVRSILDDLAVAGPSRNVLAEVEEGLLANGDATLLQDMLENLLGNAWKFSAQRDPARIAFGCRQESGKDSGERVFFVRDNGAGFDMKYADKLFGAFQRLHGPQEFEGNGIGLAMVRRIVALHGGRVWAESAPGEGATFFFTLGHPGLPGGADHA
jgi:PAS domain S-box-containing protein